jgi:hypothetical protein
MTFVDDRARVACLADRKSFPIRKWSLAFQRLRNHCPIATIFFMTTNREAPQPLCHASRLAVAPASAVPDRAADAIVHFSGIDPHSVETTLQGSIKSLRELVDVQRARAQKAEAKLSAIHALVTTPGTPMLREQIINMLRREVRR